MRSYKLIDSYKREEKKPFKEKVKEVLKYKRTRYLVVTVTVLILAIALNIAFAAFTHRNTEEVANIKVKGMNYSFAVNCTAGKTVQTNANTTKTVNVELTAENKYASKYELTYKVCTTSACTAYQAVPNNFEVKGTSPVTGEISDTGSKDITLKIINNTASNVWIEFGVNAGYAHNTLNLVGLITSESVAPPVVGPTHLTINMPNSPVGFYNSPLGGTSWDSKLGGIRVSSLSSQQSTINLNNENVTGAVNFASYIKGLSTGQGVWNEPATDWRYEGKNPNNYVWFNNELWRIIGVFSDNSHGKSGQELVKIIRDEVIGNVAWQKNNSNNWEHATSSLKMLLNDHYYNGINETGVDRCGNSNYHCYGYSTTLQGNCDFTRTGISNSGYRNMIEAVTWYLGGRADTSATAATFYSAERGTTVPTGASATGTGYIGLMYPSDYGYSVLASSCARTTNLGSYSTNACGGNSWIQRGDYEWTITPNSGSTTNVFSVDSSGHLNNNGAGNGYSVRPVLYLKSDTMKLSGTGTANDPYIIIR